MNTFDKNYTVNVTSPTGYGGGVNGVVTNVSTFVPPVPGTYTFTIVSNIDKSKGYAVNVIVR